jgi:hypothetical protein
MPRGAPSPFRITQLIVHLRQIADQAEVLAEQDPEACWYCNGRPLPEFLAIRDDGSCHICGGHGKERQSHWMKYQ